MSSKLINVKKIIEISSTCIETYPCKHYITYETKDGNIHNNCLSMPVIFQLCLELKYKTPPHIEEEYLEWKSQPPQVDKQPVSITSSCTIN
jgi:hypothetical protein